MREILFRGKRANGEWVYGDLIHRRIYTKSVCAIRCTDSGFDNYEEYYVEPVTVGQYTGLTDRNGKRIFEGDIVKATHTIHFPAEEQYLPRRAYGANYTEFGEYVYARNYVVRWNEKSARLEIRNGSDGAWLGSNYVYNHTVEVIGNIHDNPELIGGVAENAK